jgi:parvulin-like peptidyl-prolyl isomerase
LSRKRKPEPKLSVAKKKPPSWQREKAIARSVWIIISLIIVLILGLVSYWSYDTYVASWRQPVVKVNDVTLDMNYFVKMLRFYARNPDITVDTFTYPYQVLQVIEDNELIMQGAPDLNIQVTTVEVTEEIQSLLMPENEDDGNVTQSEADFDELYNQWLDMIQLSNEEYRQLVETELLDDRIIDYLRENEVPTEAEQVHLNIIPLEDEATASEVSELLKSGGNFTELATEYSIIEDLKETGGDVGWVPRGIYTELDDFAFSLEVGNVTEPISTGSGYYIIKVTEKADNMNIPEEFRDILTDSAFENWLQEQRDASIIEEFLDQDKIDWAIDRI